MTSRKHGYCTRILSRFLLFSIITFPLLFHKAYSRCVTEDSSLLGRYVVSTDTDVLKDPGVFETSETVYQLA